MGTLPGMWPASVHALANDSYACPDGVDIGLVVKYDGSLAIWR